MKIQVLDDDHCGNCAGWPKCDGDWNPIGHNRRKEDWGCFLFKPDAKTVDKWKKQEDNDGTV
jgi:hypothetical protein